MENKIMKYLCFIIALLLLSCGGEKAVTKTSIIEKIVEVESTELNLSTEYVAPSSYWCIPQYYGENKDVPKYCASGTYTNKHIPLAFKANDDIYHVYTVIEYGDFYVYAIKNNAERVLVHYLENWTDPHTNAVIHVLDSGIVHVHIASRGLSHKFQSGKILVSKTPYELDFECIDGCDNVNIEAYPQVWETSWGEHVGYTSYLKDPDIHATINIRTLWYRVGEDVKQLVEGGHYSVSYYDGETLYLAYNQLVDGKPDNRINLYVIKTNDGINWTNLSGKALTLPLSPHNDDALVYESSGYVYLKDITVGDFGLKILFTESTDYDPTKGIRIVKEWTPTGMTSITETNHNYNAGAYVGGNILITQDGIKGWTGGDIVLYRNYVEIARDNSSNCNYIRKVINSNDKAVVSCDNFHLDGTASHYILTID